MPGKVFISCGMASEEERGIARDVETLLESEFGLDPHVEIDHQNLDEVTASINELRSSDYYIFIDLYRDDGRSFISKLLGWGRRRLPISLFSHQELALAWEYGFNDKIIAFRDERFAGENISREGLLAYLGVNARTFSNRADLLRQLKETLLERNWSSTYSRHLVPTTVQRITPPAQYTDHMGSSTEVIWHAEIENRRNDTAAVDAVCILDGIETVDGQEINLEDRTPLKWAGRMEAYRGMILPRDSRKVDLLAVRKEQQGIFLHSQSDEYTTPAGSRTPVIDAPGEYIFSYKIYARDLPLLEFHVKVKYRQTSNWQNSVSAYLTEIGPRSEEE